MFDTIQRNTQIYHFIFTFINMSFVKKQTNKSTNLYLTRYENELNIIVKKEKRKHWERIV